MPMDKGRYPANWKEIALNVKNAAGWRCAACGMKCREPGEKFVTHKRTLTVHHIDHQPENCSPENLIALCSGCHLKADAQFHAEHRKQRREAIQGGRALPSVRTAKMRPLKNGTGERDEMRDIALGNVPEEVTVDADV